MRHSPIRQDSRRGRAIKTPDLCLHAGEGNRATADGRLLAPIADGRRTTDQDHIGDNLARFRVDTAIRADGVADGPASAIEGFSVQARKAKAHRRTVGDPHPDTPVERGDREDTVGGGADDATDSDDPGGSTFGWRQLNVESMLGALCRRAEADAAAKGATTIEKAKDSRGRHHCQQSPITCSDDHPDCLAIARHRHGDHTRV